MASTTRTFLAVAVPEALETKLTRLQQQLAPTLVDVRWSAAPPFHVTLAFLGDVAVADLNTVCKAVVASAAGFAPFMLRLEGLGVFPNPARPRVLWTGVGGAGVETLGELHAALGETIARLNYRGDGRTYQPHVTLGMFKPGSGGDPSANQALNHMLGHYKTWRAGPFSVTEVVAFSSTLGRDGPTYSALVRAPLRARKTGPTQTA